jgi:hypothetical protein
MMTFYAALALAGQVRGFDHWAALGAVSSVLGWLAWWFGRGDRAEHRR